MEQGTGSVFQSLRLVVHLTRPLFQSPLQLLVCGYVGFTIAR
jgi:hypothetical protein